MAKRIITELLVPDWVEWTAEDAYGTLWGSLVEPKPSERVAGQWAVQWLPPGEKLVDQCIILSQSDNRRDMINPDWRQSLRRVEEVRRD